MKCPLGSFRGAMCGHFCRTCRRCGIAAAVLAGMLAGSLLTNYWSSIGAFFHDLTQGPVKDLAAWVGAVVAFATLLYQISRARFNQRVELILKLSERFDAPAMLKLRATAAAALRQSPDTRCSAVGRVLSFFEEIGFLLERRAIDVDAAYEFFEYWAVPYYQATAQFRAMERARYSGLYSEFEKLRRALACLDPEGDRDEGELSRFLDEEAALVGETPRQERRDS